jgi:RNA polymerase sigma-70 factor (ECF subfamily)
MGERPTGDPPERDADGGTVEAEAVATSVRVVVGRSGGPRRRLTTSESAALFEAHGAAVRRYVGFRVGDPADADDLAAEVYRRLVSGEAPVDPSMRPAWLLRIAHNLVVDHYRRRRRFDPLALIVDRPDDAPPPLDAILRDERLRDVDRALARLPGRQRAAVYLRYHEDLDYEAVAAILGAPLPTVRSLVHRGLRRIAAELRSEEDA